MENLEDSVESIELENPPANHRSFIRPHSAKPKKSDDHSESKSPEPQLTRTLRPWTANPKTRAAVSKKKIVRQNLRKSHMRPPSRSSKSGSVSPTSTSTTDQALTVVGIENADLAYTPRVYHLPRDDEPEVGGILEEGVRTLISERISGVESPVQESWALTQMNDVPDTPDKDKKPHPNVDTWVMGSPHDSDEYDTDLEVDMMKKEERAIDPTGQTAYQDQCKRQGLVPVSYLARHLGDRNLRMRHHYIGGPATKPIARALELNTITENLDLGDNYLEAEGAVYIARVMKDNTFIVSLDISNNFIGTPGARAIADMLEYNSTLKSLNLSANQLTDRDARYFIEALKANICLTSLDLSNNEFGELGGIYLGGALTFNEGLTELDLSWNSIRNKGAEAIAKALSTNAVLEVLDLSWNGFGLHGTKTLQQSLRVNTKLKVLDLSNNRLNKDAAKELSQGIGKNFGLETLLLNLNPFNDEGIEMILKSVIHNQSLCFVSLEDLNLNVENYKKIQEIEGEREITILHSGIGGAQRHTQQNSVLRALSKFLCEHRSELEDAFIQQDKIGVEYYSVMNSNKHLKKQRQMGLLIDEIDAHHAGSVKYADILSGKVLGDFNTRKTSMAYRVPRRGSRADILENMRKRQLTVI
ncbi:hypothetical protein FSP39_021279 [Pinctada imbricata]|uniref:Uncharacterized protein n=1 Tax=Pinctada imbricata TaxID=66713 RepID=A0AA88YS68_PINIB|nr:hypothetical protein FSP39_021279 [Pinctada imbricata]